MRILQISSAAKLGGGETHVVDLVRFLRQRGHGVTLAGRPHSPLNADVEMAFRNSADVFTGFQLRRFIRRNSFDLVHAHVARDYPVAAAALTGLRTPKLVVTRHLLYPLRPNPLYRRVDGWIATTAEIEQRLIPLTPRRTIVIPNWVDTGRFHFRGRALQAPVVLGLLGQVAPHKGHDDAIETMSLLGKGFRLLIAGSGDAEYMKRLLAKARDLPVEFTGFLPAPEALARMDILLVPSWEEPFGIVILEAMAAGVPVVATDAGGPRSILTEGVTGLLVTPKNPRALADAVQRLLDDTLRQRIIRKARSDVESRFDIATVASEIERFYQEIIEAGA